jgi:sulfoxide reductase heme-binding subunit YedZ
MSSMTLAVTPSSYWFLTRGAGAIALVLLSAGMVLGILDVKRFSSERWPRFVIDRLHRNVSLLALAVLLVHIVTALADGFAPIAIKDVIIPFGSAYRPLWLGLGSLAFDLLLAVSVTSILHARLGNRAWRAVHWAAYACWPLAIIHGLGTGSDGAQVWMLALTVACVSAALGAAAWRTATATGVEDRHRTVAMLAITAAPVALFVWTLAGPLAGGWALRAGTPASLITAAHPALTASRSQPPKLQVPFSARLSGPLLQSPVSTSGLVGVDLPMKMSKGESGTLGIRIVGQPLQGGGVAMSQSTVTMGPPGQPTLYTGRLTSLQGTHLTASVSGAAGAEVSLQIDVSIDQATETVGGSLNAAGT